MMKKLLLITLGCVSSSVFAANAAPFGEEVGVSKCANVRKDLASKVNFEENGTNKYTGGVMYIGNAENLGFDDAKSVLLICDKSDILAGLQLTLDKGSMEGNFNKYNKMLKAKYKQVKIINPFVGDKYAKYTQGNSSVELDSPHMSFDMTITYATNQLLQSYKTTSNSENNAKQKQQQNSL